LRLTFVAAGVAGFLAPSVDLPSWQLTADVTIGSALRFGHPFDSSRAVLRVHALIEPIVVHPGVFGSSSAIAPSRRRLPHIEQLKVFVR
jgi:hypothetical protein